MSSGWNDIHRNLVRSASTLAFHTGFQTLREEHAALAGFVDPAALLDHLHHGSAPAEDKNSLLGALIEAGQSSTAAADVAVSLMLLALWPGLDAVHHRLSRRAAARDDLPSQILAEAVEVVRRLDLRAVRRIAATILMNVERDVGRADARERQRHNLAVDFDVDLIGDDRNGHPGMSGILLRDVVRHAGADAHLVVSVAVEGFSQVEMAVTLGVSEAATRKRYQRAISRLRCAFSDSLSRPAPPPGFSLSGAHAPSQEPEGTGLMTCIDNAEDLTRMPGLFRRWEFPDVMEPRRTYRLEEAGAHADGTPLVAIYTGPAKENEADRPACDNRTPKAGGV